MVASAVRVARSRLLRAVVVVAVLATAGVGMQPAHAAAANDNLADAIDLGPLPVATTGDTTGATTESGEQEACAPIGATVWFLFTPAVSERVRITTAGSAFDTVVTVYEHAATGPMEQVGCDDDGGPGLTSRLSVPVVAGTTYAIQLGGFDGESGAFALAADAVAPPPGDKFEAPVVVELPYTGSVDLIDGSIESGEESSRCGWEPLSTVWYQVAAPASAAGVRVSITDAAFFGSVTVYRGNALDALDEIACDDFGFGDATAYARAVAGDTLLVRLDADWMPSGSTANIAIAPFDSPANDDIADAETVNTVGERFTRQVAGASVEAGEPACVGETGSIWFSYTATDTEPLVVSMSGSDGFAATGVYTVAAGGGLTKQSCNLDTVNGPEASFLAQEGTTYLIQASGYESGVGDVELTLLRGASAGVQTPFGGVVAGAATDNEDEYQAYGIGYAPFVAAGYSRSEDERGGSEWACAIAVVIGFCSSGGWGGSGG